MIFNSMYFQISSFFYIVMLIVVYFYKKRLTSFENKIYVKMLVSNLVGLVLDVASIFTIMNMDKFPILNFVVTRFYLLYLLFWVSLFTVYTISICCKGENNVLEKQENILKTFLGLFIIFGLIIFLLPLNYFNNGIEIYSYGLSATFSYIVGGIYIFICLFLTVTNFKKIKKIKCVPLIVYLIMFPLILSIQAINPQILLVTSLESFITFLMYFTIENPDIKMIEQLEIAKSQADKANHAKTDFLSSMSHEIRTPLNAIVGFSDCIEQSNTLDEAKDNAKDIVSASKTLLEIVNGILDISKIEAGRLEIVNTTYNARSTFLNLSKLVKPRIDEKGLDFDVFIAPDLPDALYGDHANIKKIVTNLLSNAAKYTDTGYVRYEVNCINGPDTCKLIISVEDSGRGVKKEDVDKLFTKFQRLDEDRNTTIEGTGLGLAITKQLIELMGGKIFVHTVYGEGSKFTVVLNQKIENATALEKKKKTRTTLDLSDDRILLVDDNKLNLKVATKLLEKYNARDIVCVDSGFLCLEKISAGEKFDVILLDDMMPKMSGVETLHKLKEIAGFNTPVVILTANAITGMKSKYLSEGFNGYLAKPIEKEKMIQVLNEVLDKSPTTEVKLDDIKKSISDEKKSEDNNLPEVNNSTDDANDGEKFLRDHGVDMDNALSLLGDIEMYNDTLKDYLSEVDDKFVELKGYKEQNDMKNYAILVHSMKSDAKYLGLMDFADVAYEHELKSKEGDSSFVSDNFSRLEDELNKALAIVKEYAKNI